MSSAQSFTQFRRHESGIILEVSSHAAISTCNYSRHVESLRLLSSFLQSIKSTSTVVTTVTEDRGAAPTELCLCCFVHCGTWNGTRTHKSITEKRESTKHIRKGCFSRDREAQMAGDTSQYQRSIAECLCALAFNPQITLCYTDVHGSSSGVGRPNAVIAAPQHNRCAHGLVPRTRATGSKRVTHHRIARMQNL